MLDNATLKEKKNKCRKLISLSREKDTYRDNAVSRALYYTTQSSVLDMRYLRFILTNLDSLLRFPNPAFFSGWTDKCIDLWNASAQTLIKYNSKSEIHMHVKIQLSCHARLFFQRLFLIMQKRLYRKIPPRRVC